MYIISPITVFDEDKELFETHIGLDDEARTLLLSAWGKTEEESKLCAAGTINRLNFNIEEIEHHLDNPELNKKIKNALDDLFIKGECKID